VIDALIGLEKLPVAITLRNSVWLYPLVNTAHIVGIALLFGAIVPYDLRLLGLWRSVDSQALARILVPVAASGFAIAICAGALLFVTRAGEYLSSPFFLAKMAAIAAALVCAAVAFAAGRRTAWARPGGITPVMRVCAGLSLTLWLTVIALGRLIGYF
jgi:hypothetical protein